MSGPKFFVPIMHRRAIEDLIYDMLYASSKSRYEEAMCAFKTRASKVSMSLVSYFLDNWNTCSNMWANYVRRECFSGGNTTSNRIEANWNQFKQLLAKSLALTSVSPQLFSSK